MPSAPKTGDWLALFVLTVLWGSAFLFNELALAAFPPTVLVAGRILIATAFICGYLRLAGETLPPLGRAWLPLLVLAVFGNVLPFHLVAWAQQYIDSSMAGILMAVMPLFVLTLAHFFIPGARLTPRRSIGFLVGFAGVVVILGPDSFQGAGNRASFWGALAALGAAFSYSISTIFARRMGPGDPLQRSAGMLIVASLLSMPAAFIELPLVTSPSAVATVALGVLGLLATGFATILYFRLIQGPGPTFLSLVNYMVPAWAVIAGTMFLGESLSPTVMIGLALILAGIAFSELSSRVGQATRGVWQRYRTTTPCAAARDEI
jgi:drug/metabolite transporter (DMT)-like permease